MWAGAGVHGYLEPLLAWAILRPGQQVGQGVWRGDSLVVVGRGKRWGGQTFTGWVYIEPGYVHVAIVDYGFVDIYRKGGLCSI